MKHLGEDLDIHCGGIDNAFPHHTNEIAQSESYLGHKWCNFWMHVHHLNTTSGKMSKSSGEFLTVSLLEERGYDPLAYRFFCLQSHYRKALVFSWENLSNAQGAYQKLIARIAALKPGTGPVVKEDFDALREKFCAALDNDLNTSLAVTVLYDILKADTTDDTKLAAIDHIDSVLRLDLNDRAIAKREADAAAAAAAAAAKTAAAFAVIPEDGAEDASVTERILARQAAKKAKDYAAADRIRDELKAEGIELTDIPGGAKWKRI
jgi:cysteinyl-tRNA synthetase